MNAPLALSGLSYTNPVYPIRDQKVLWSGERRNEARLVRETDQSIAATRWYVGRTLRPVFHDRVTTAA
jgi:hypothetical protein